MFIVCCQCGHTVGTINFTEKPNLNRTQMWQAKKWQCPCGCNEFHVVVETKMQLTSNTLWQDTLVKRVRVICMNCGKYYDNNDVLAHEDLVNPLKMVIHIKWRQCKGCGTIFEYTEHSVFRDYCSQPCKLKGKRAQARRHMRLQRQARQLGTIRLKEMLVNGQKRVKVC
jgi:hypothetical protein